MNVTRTLVMTLLLSSIVMGLSQVLLTQTASRVVAVYASNGTTPTPIRPALVKPVIDGKYTDVKELELTEAGRKWVAEGKPLPKDEWDDGNEIKLAPWNNPRLPVEGYLILKFYGDRFGMMGDILSDKKVSQGELFTILFNTKNIPNTADKYYLDLTYATNSPDSLAPTSRPIGIPIPSNARNYKSSLGPSPRSSEPHKLLEAEFDLNLLTKDYKEIGFGFFAMSTRGALAYDPSGYGQILFSDQTLPIVSGIWWVTFSISGLPSDFLAPIYVDSLTRFETRAGEKKTVTIESGKQHTVSVPESIPSSEGSRYFCFTNSYVVKSACEVNFAYKTQHYLKLVKGEGAPGKSSLEGEGWYDKGSSARIKVSPTESSEGFLTIRFSGWKIGSNMISTDPEPVIPIDSPKTLTTTWSTSMNPVPVTLYVVLPIAAIVVVVGLAYLKIRSGKRRLTSWQRSAVR